VRRFKGAGYVVNGIFAHACSGWLQNCNYHRQGDRILSPFEGLPVELVYGDKANWALPSL
jgi:hypothetical protein